MPELVDKDYGKLQYAALKQYWDFSRFTGNSL
jgi:hypothetical protein